MNDRSKLLSTLELLVSENDYYSAFKILKNNEDDIEYVLNDKRYQKKLIELVLRIYNHLELDINIGTYKYLKILNSTYSHFKYNVDYLDIRVKNFIKQGKLQECEEYLKNIQMNDDINLTNRIYFHLATVYFRSGDNIKAVYYINKALPYYLNENNYEYCGRSYYLLGYIEFQRGFYEIAESYFIKAVYYYKKAKQNYSIGKTYHMLGILNYRKNDFENAEQYLMRAQEIYSKYKHKKIQSIEVNEAIGRVLILEKKVEKAIPYFKKSIRDSRKIGYKRGEALAREFLGEAFYLEHSYNKALRYLKEALKLAKEIAPEGDIAVEVYRRLGDTYIATGRLKRAESSLNKALDIAQKLEDRYELGTILRAIAVLHFMRDDIEGSRSYFKEAITTLVLLKEKKELAGTYFAASDCFYQWMTKNRSSSPDSSVFSDAELLKEAKDYLIEAVNIYSTLGFKDDISKCKRLLNKIENREAKEPEVREVRTIIFNRNSLFNKEIIAVSQSMISVLEKAKLLAESDMPVLILGETGTGKELLARYIHGLSNRRERPFIAINCAAIPHPVFESELFGHVRGAFTGAYRDKVGLIEKANGGTIFLDEVFELDTEEQAKFLRVLQEGIVRRVGDTKERRIDVRVISATNNNVSPYLNTGRLRKDFYYRICTEAIEIEPLRKRKDDILPLVAYYMQGYRGSVRIEKAAIDKLLDYFWPGNVRELIGTAKMLAILSKDKDAIFKEHLPQRIRDFAAAEKAILTGSSQALFKFNSSNEHQINELIAKTLEQYNGNRSKAARKLGISRATLYRWMRKLSI